MQDLESVYWYLFAIVVAMVLCLVVMFLTAPYLSDEDIKQIRPRSLDDL